MSKNRPINVSIFGDRVLFTEVKEELTGSLILPEKTHRAYEIGQVLSVGDGRVRRRDGSYENRQMLVNVGDYIWFQINRSMADNNTLRIDGKSYMHILQHDMLARLKTPKVDINEFEILGKWCLMDTFEDATPGSRILLPGTASDNVRMLRYKIVQRGALVSNDIQVGDEVVIEKRAAQLVAINDKPFFYIDYDNIVGKVGAGIDMSLINRELAK